MEVRSVGKSGLKVSALGLGTMTFGASTTYMKDATADDAVARHILDLALDRGITLIDTANSYSQGRTETLLGEWLGTKRNSIVLASKCGLPVPAESQPGPYRDRGLSRSHIIESCEASLKRLQTDRIDLYQMHLQDGSVPIDETLRACDDLIRAGKIRYVGCSNYTGYRLTEAAMTARHEGMSPYISVQAQWSLAVRDAEREVIPAAVAQGMGAVIWSPLARGLLSGKFSRDTSPPPGSRLSRWTSSYDRLNTERTWAIVDMVAQIARKHQVPSSAVALAWVLSRSAVSSVLIGAKSIEQFSENVAAAGLILDDEELLRLDHISALDWGYPYDFIGERHPW
jgi:aryl-alcohol dehydrogenase-like predicted oxidoreductase